MRIINNHTHNHSCDCDCDSVNNGINQLLQNLNEVKNLTQDALKERPTLGFDNESRPIEITKEKLFNILLSGSTYEGTGSFSATATHPEGLSTQMVFKVEEYPNTADEVNWTNELICTDNKSGEVAYIAKRVGKYYYKPNHRNKLFLVAHTIMNDKTVSSQYGMAIGMTDDAIILETISSWHVHERNFKNVKKLLRRNGDNLTHSVFNFNMVGDLELSIEETYTKV